MENELLEIYVNRAAYVRVHDVPYTGKWMQYDA